MAISPGTIEAAMTLMNLTMRMASLAVKHAEMARDKREPKLNELALMEEETENILDEWRKLAPAEADEA